MKPLVFSPLLYRLSYLAPVCNRYPMGNRILLPQPSSDRHKDFNSGITLHSCERLAFTETSDGAACFQSSALPTELLGHCAANTTWTWQSIKPTGGHPHKDFSSGITLHSRERLAFTETSDEAACLQSSALPTELLGPRLQHLSDGESDSTALTFQRPTQGF